MATLSVDKHKEQNDELTKALNEIITQNLTIGISKLDDPDDFNDDHVDIKSNASTKWRRGSVSYSQPCSPKGNPSLSPVSSVSSLSELSTEYHDDGDSESCASLNSVNSTMSNDSTLYNGMLHGIISTELVIDENKANTDPVPIDDDNHNQNKNNNENITNNKHTLNHNKNRKNNNTNNKNKNKLNIPINKKQHKHKKRKHGLTKSMSYDNSSKSSSKHRKIRKSASRPKYQRRNSKDCLDITAISRLTIKAIPSWSIDEVVEWIKLIDNGKYKEYADKFKQKKIDGKKLYKLNRTMLQSIEVYHPSARKAILAALQKLKTKIRQNSKKQINLYAKKHGYHDKKTKHQKKHRRGLSTPNGPNMQKLKLRNKEKYVVAVKKRNNDKLSIMPGMTPSISAPLRKKSQDISEFLDEWDIKQSQDSNINFLNSTILEQTDNFTMIELENKRIVYAVTAKVEKWDNNDVCKWLNSISGSRFKRFIDKFKQRNTNGFDLLNISRVQLQNNIGMMDATMRSTLLREIKLLKLATQWNKKHLLKKRSSAISVNDIQKVTKKTGHGGHRRSASSITGSKSLSALTRVENIGFVQRKLGPRDIGRSDYKGTKYERDLFNFDFMEEKINYHSKSAQFNKRKQLNPVKHKETVDEIGVCTDFTKPRYTNDILQSMKYTEWLKDKPISRRNPCLDSLKGSKILRNDLVSDMMQKPIGWKPIEYNFKNDGKEFLEEHFWFDGSAVQFEFGFSRLLNCLPPTKLLTLNKAAAPTGYESKLNWLRMLLSMVTEEIKLIQKEDALYKEGDIICISNQHNQDNQDNMVPILAEPSVIIQIIEEEKEEKEKEKEKEKGIMQRKSINMDDMDDVDDVDDNTDDVECVDVNKFRRRRNMDKAKMNMDAAKDIMDGESDSSSNISEEILSSPSSSNNLSSPDMKTKRANYKITRNRANTTLANSTLGKIGGSNQSGMAPMTPRTRKRMLSRQDINRRRFMSQESVDSIQAIITNIEKKRTTTNLMQ